MANNIYRDLTITVGGDVADVNMTSAAYGRIHLAKNANEYGLTLEDATRTSILPVFNERIGKDGKRFASGIRFAFRGVTLGWADLMNEQKIWFRKGVPDSAKTEMLMMMKKIADVGTSVNKIMQAEKKQRAEDRKAGGPYVFSFSDIAQAVPGMSGNLRFYISGNSSYVYYDSPEPKTGTLMVRGDNPSRTFSITDNAMHQEILNAIKRGRSIRPEDVTDEIRAASAGEPPSDVISDAILYGRMSYEIETFKIGKLEFKSMPGKFEIDTEVRYDDVPFCKVSHGNVLHMLDFDENPSMMTLRSAYENAIAASWAHAKNVSLSNMNPAEIDEDMNANANGYGP